MKIVFSYVDGGVHPKLGQVYHWQPKAVDGEGTKRYNQYLCEVLSSVAQGIDDCDRLLGDLSEVESGHQNEIQTGGNDVTLTIRPSGVQVDIEINDDWVGQPEGRFELSEWKNALKGWRLFLEKPASLQTVVEVEL